MSQCLALQHLSLCFTLWNMWPVKVVLQMHDLSMINVNIKINGAFSRHWLYLQLFPIKIACLQFYQWAFCISDAWGLPFLWYILRGESLTKGTSTNIICMAINTNATIQTWWGSAFVSRSFTHFTSPAWKHCTLWLGRGDSGTYTYLAGW